MSHSFLAGIVVGLLTGGFVGTLVVAFVAAASERSLRVRGKRSRA
jgi:ABC-type Mn2+/Zn2+ transport system permease subunit